MSKLSLSIQEACTWKTITSKKKEVKPIKKVWEKKRNRLASDWSESVLFMRRFNDLKDRWNNYCIVTGELLTIDKLSPASFPHILPKGKYPELRLFSNNIWLVKWIEEHWIFDSYVNKYKEYYWSINLENDIKDGKEVIQDIINYNHYEKINYDKQ
jgi:hypothetical protein